MRHGIETVEGTKDSPADYFLTPLPLRLCVGFSSVFVPFCVRSAKLSFRTDTLKNQRPLVKANVRHGVNCAQRKRSAGNNVSLQVNARPFEFQSHSLGKLIDTKKCYNV